MTISNWNGSNRCAPAAVAVPLNLSELCAVVRDTTTYPSPVRAVGELHSLNESIETDGTAVFMTHFKKEMELRGNTVTVGAGVRMIDLNKELKKHGLQLPVVPEIGNATAGSVACCGTKDSSLGEKGRGQISSTVVGVRMVMAGGNKREFTIDKDLPMIRAIRSSYGLLGIIYEVTFEVETRKKVWYEYARLDLDPSLKAGVPLPPPDSEEILGRADGFLGFLLPYRRELLIERRRLAEDRPRMTIRGRRPTAAHEPRPLDRFKLWLRTFAWRWGARPFNTVLRRLPKRVRRFALNTWISILDRGFLRMFFMKGLVKFESYRADAMIDFKRPVSSYFDFTFWAFPVSSWARVVPAYVEFCERFLRETGFRPALPTEVYFIRRDDAAPLSFSAGEDIFTLDMVNWSDDEPAWWAAMNREFCEFAAEHGGRPLLNQTKGLSPAVADRLHRERPDAWSTLARERGAWDPDKRFLTPFLRDLLP
jgi:FAD/FMN-containing dehydrogenase